MKNDMKVAAGAAMKDRNAIIIGIADFRFRFSGPDLCGFVSAMPFFTPFLEKAHGDEDTKADFTVSEELGIAEISGLEEICGKLESCFDVSFEDISCSFFRNRDTIIFRMDEEHSGKELWETWRIGDCIVRSSIVRATATMYRYALWTAVNFLTCMHGCMAIHCSANVFDGRTVIFLGESGTGKSTHTRLLRERYPDSFLLNDDSPFVRVMPDGRVMVFGSPWSGKTPCYRAESYPLAAAVRLSQAPHNRIRRLNPLQAVGALLPSAPPMLNYTEETSDALYKYISDVLEKVPAWHLECLPDKEAAELSHDTVL